MRQMRLKQTGEQLEPFDEFDRALFAHCTHGSHSITLAYLEELREVFIAHGVDQVQINGKPRTL